MIVFLEVVFVVLLLMTVYTVIAVGTLWILRRTLNWYYNKYGTVRRIGNDSLEVDILNRYEEMEENRAKVIKMNEEDSI